MNQEQEPREEVAASLQSFTDVGFSSRLRVLADLMDQVGNSTKDLREAINQLPREEAVLLLDVLREGGQFSEQLSQALPIGSKLLQAVQRDGQAYELEEVDSTQFLPLQSRKSYPIARDEVLLVTKDSKIQYDMKRFQLNSVKEVLALYREGEEDIQRILNSHTRQQESLKQLQQVFPSAQFVGRDEITTERLAAASLVVSVGGDNHFQWVADHIIDDTPVLGLNSDPDSSTGALLPFNTESFLEFLDELEAGTYQFSPWTRIEATLDGKRLGPVTCDVFVGQKNREYMSRHVMKLGEDQIEQKSSGLLISNGAGSTGWYNNAIRAMYPRGYTFPPDAPYARFITTEVSGKSEDTEDGSSLSFPRLSEGALLPGETMEIHSLNREGGIVSIDSLFREPFERGSVLEIRIDPQPLWRVEPTVQISNCN